MLPSKLPNSYQTTIDSITTKLPQLLAENLYSCVLYGSTVRGEVNVGISDINILIILNESTPNAHTAISDCLHDKIYIDPFVITRRGMERSFDAFAIKFRSIQRDYEVLHGEDPFTEFNVKSETNKFLTEQALRNLRLRAVHSYITNRKKSKQYLNYLHQIDTNIIVLISEALRINNIDVPHDFSQRLAVFKTEYNMDVSILTALQQLKSKPHHLSSNEITSYHSALFNLIDHVVRWTEDNWG